MKSRIIIGMILGVFVIVCIVLGLAIIAEAAVESVLMFTVLVMAWYSMVPERCEKWWHWAIPVFWVWNRWFLTTIPGAILVEVGLWYIGWKAMPDVGSIKTGFMMLHVWVLMFLAFQHYSVRKQHAWQQPQ